MYRRFWHNDRPAKSGLPQLSDHAMRPAQAGNTTRSPWCRSCCHHMLTCDRICVRHLRMDHDQTAILNSKHLQAGSRSHDRGLRSGSSVAHIQTDHYFLEDDAHVTVFPCRFPAISKVCSPAIRTSYSGGQVCLACSVVPTNLVPSCLLSRVRKLLDRHPMKRS